MKLRNMSLDGGSLIIGLMILCVGFSILMDGWNDNEIGNVPAIVASVLLAGVGSVFFWLSVRIARDRQRIKDVRRWLGENPDEHLNGK